MLERPLPQLPRTKPWRALLAAATLAFHGGLPAYADAVQEYTAKSVLALNLARYSDWPPEAFKDGGTTLSLCVLGDEVVQQAFALIDKKQVGGRILSVRGTDDGRHLDPCQLLYVSADADSTALLFEESRKRHILTIGETEGFLAQGGMVYLEMADPKINLHVNLDATQKAGVQISARVLKLAIIFKP